MTIAIGITLWLACGIAHHPIFFAYFQRKYSSVADETYWIDLSFSLTAILLGPIALLATFMTCKPRYGLKWY